MKKHMTREDTYVHKARERMRALRGETGGTVGERLPFPADPQLRRVRLDGGEIGPCFDCGYITCSCSDAAEKYTAGRTPWHAYTSPPEDYVKPMFRSAFDPRWRTFSDAGLAPQARQPAPSFNPSAIVMRAGAVFSIDSLGNITVTRDVPSGKQVAVISIDECVYCLKEACACDRTAAPATTSRRYDGRIDLVPSVSGGEPLGVLWLREFGPVSAGDFGFLSLPGAAEYIAYTKRLRSVGCYG